MLHVLEGDYDPRHCRPGTAALDHSYPRLSVPHPPSDHLSTRLINELTLALSASAQPTLPLSTSAQSKRSFISLMTRETHSPTLGLERWTKNFNLHIWGPCSTLLQIYYSMFKSSTPMKMFSRNICVSMIRIRSQYTASFMVSATVGLLYSIASSFPCGSQFVSVCRGILRIEAHIQLESSFTKRIWRDDGNTLPAYSRIGW